MRCQPRIRPIRRCRKNMYIVLYPCIVMQSGYARLCRWCFLPSGFAGEWGIFLVFLQKSSNILFLIPHGVPPWGIVLCLRTGTNSLPYAPDFCTSLLLRCATFSLEDFCAKNKTKQGWLCTLSSPIDNCIVLCQ